MKKIISGILSLTIAFGILMPVKAADTEEMKKILTLVKSRIDIQDEGMEFYSNTDEYDNKRTYHFNWEGNGKSIDVSCDNSGIIKLYNYRVKEEDDWNIYKYNGEKYSFSDFNIENAKANAEKLAKKINPDLDFSVEATPPSIYNDDIEFDLTLMHDGYKVENVSAGMSMSDENTLSRYYFYYDDINEYGYADKIKTDEEAKNTFLDKIGLELVYVGNWEEDKATYTPKYIQKYNDKFIDAQTGEVMDIYDSSALYKEDSASGALAEKNAKFTDEEIAEFDEISNYLSKEQVEKSLRENKKLDIGDLPLESVSLRKYYGKDVYIYNLLFEDDKKYVFVNVNALNGDVYRYSTWSDKDRKDATENELNQLAQIMTPSIADEYKYNEGVLSRYENGIRVAGDDIYVTYDADGKLVSYYVNYTDNAEFMPLDNVIDKTAIEQKLFDTEKYEKRYYVKADKKAYLVYKFDKYIEFDAVTGKSWDEDEDDGSYTYDDIDGHYAKDKIEKLSEYGIGLPYKSFEPNKDITEEDFYNLLSSIGYYVQSDNATAVVTRENAAKILLKKLGGEDIAKYDDIYVQPFKDVTENKGYIAVLKAMGIVNGDENGNFNPKRNMTRAEAAVLIYNYLDRNNR